MPWLWLALASVCEVAWAIGLKYSDGLTRPAASAFTIAGMLASFWFLALATRELPIGTAYAIWTGFGAVATALLGMWLFHEPRSLGRLASIALIIIGIVGLKLADGATSAPPAPTVRP